jgi:hypothetical protein
MAHAAAAEHSPFDPANQRRRSLRAGSDRCRRCRRWPSPHLACNPDHSHTAHRLRGSRISKRSPRNPAIAGYSRSPRRKPGHHRNRRSPGFPHWGSNRGRDTRRRSSGWPRVCHRDSAATASRTPSHSATWCRPRRHSCGMLGRRPRRCHRSSSRRPDRRLSRSRPPGTHDTRRRWPHPGCRHNSRRPDRPAPAARSHSPPGCHRGCTDGWPDRR